MLSDCRVGDQDQRVSIINLKLIYLLKRKPPNECNLSQEMYVIDGINILRIRSLDRCFSLLLVHQRYCRLWNSLFSLIYQSIYLSISGSSSCNASGTWIWPTGRSSPKKRFLLEVKLSYDPVCPSIGWFFCLSVIIFLEGGKLHFHAHICTLV